MLARNTLSGFLGFLGGTGGSRTPMAVFLGGEPPNLPEACGSGSRSWFEKLCGTCVFYHRSREYFARSMAAARPLGTSLGTRSRTGTTAVPPTHDKPGRNEVAS